MIWALIDALANPHAWAIRRDRDGTITLAPVDHLRDKGVKVLPQKDQPA